MPDGYIQLPTEGAGKKLRTRDLGAAGHDQFVALGALPTYYYWTGYVTGAAGKVYLDLWNATGSGKVVRVKKVYVQSNLAAVTGAQSLFDFVRTTAIGTAGTALTAALADTTDAAVPAQITARTGATGGATSGTPTLFGYPAWSEETAAPAALMGMIAANPEGPEIKEIVLRENQGFAVKQPTAGAGAWGVLVVATIE
jgi:hypothetical protein